MKTLFIGLLLVSSKAFGWGVTGHRVVGIVAEKLLDPAVAVKILEITKGQSLARVSTWPDEIKSEPATYSHTYNWHFTDWKRINTRRLQRKRFWHCLHRKHLVKHQRLCNRNR